MLAISPTNSISNPRRCASVLRVIAQYDQRCFHNFITRPTREIRIHNTFARISQPFSLQESGIPGWRAQGVRVIRHRHWIAARRDVPKGGHYLCPESAHLPDKAGRISFFVQSVLSKVYCGVIVP